MNIKTKHSRIKTLSLSLGQIKVRKGLGSVKKTKVQVSIKTWKRHSKHKGKDIL